MYARFTEFPRREDSASESDPLELHLLIKRAQGRDFAAFRQLAFMFDAAVLETASRITGSARLAAKLYRRTFLRAYRKLAHFHFECSFSVWIFRQLAQLCMEHLRLGSPLANLGDDPCFAGVLNQLTPLERMIIELKFGHGFSLSLVSEILEMPKDVVRLSFLCAKGKMRTIRCAEVPCIEERPFLEEVT
jgi:DNA-directed RNA polymerase specialized sigma24 family protein